MKKCLVFCLIAALCCWLPALYGAQDEKILNNGNILNENSVAQLLKEEKAADDIFTSLAKLSDEERALIAELLILRVRYALTVLAQNRADLVNHPFLGAKTLNIWRFDSIRFELQKKIETVLKKISHKTAEVLTQIDLVSEKQSPQWNMKAINCYMDMRQKFSENLVKLLGRKLMDVKKQYNIRMNKFEGLDIVVPQNYADIIENMDYDWVCKKKACPFFSISDFEGGDLFSYRTVVGPLYTYLKEVGKKNSQVQKSLIAKLNEDNAYKITKQSFDIFKAHGETFETGIANIDEMTHFFTLYSAILEQCVSKIGPKDFSITKTIEVLDAFLFNDSCDFSTKKECAEILSGFMKIIKEIEQAPEAKAEAGSDCKGILWYGKKTKNKKPFKEATDKLKDKYPGFFRLFFEHFIDVKLKVKFLLSDSDSIENDSTEKCAGLNGAFYLYPLMEHIIQYLQSKTANVSRKSIKKAERQKKIEQREAKKWLAAQKGDEKKHRAQKKTKKNNKRYGGKKHTETTMAAVAKVGMLSVSGDVLNKKEKDEKATTTQTANMLEVDKKNEKQIGNAPVTTKNDSLAIAIKESSAFLKKKAETTVVGGHLVFSVGMKTPAGVRTGILVSKENAGKLGSIEDCVKSNSLTADRLDFMGLKENAYGWSIRNNTYHRIPFKALSQSDEILKSCELVKVDGEGKSYIDNLAKTYKLFIAEDIKTLLILDCFLQTTGVNTTGAMQKITKKLSKNEQQKLFGLHEGAVVLMSPDSVDSLKESKEKKLRIRHIRFHESIDSQNFHRDRICSGT